MKENKGITLIALIITVIVLLILAGTAISIAINGGDIFSKASEAREQWNNAVKTEETQTNDALQILNSMTNDGTMPTLISKEQTVNNGSGYVGYYADFDGIPGVDGIIYADLLVQKPASGQWKNIQGAYTIPTTVTDSNVKDYVISKTPVTDARFEKTGADPSTYTARYVISPSNSSSGTESRFYVMGLDDITDGTNNKLYWYYSAYRNMNDYNNSTTGTANAFGTGKRNTDRMLAKWDPAGDETTEGLYGDRNSRDIWKQVKNKRAQYAGWYIPSAGEWGAFANAFNISNTSTDTTYYENYGLDTAYWTSSQYDTGFAWTINFCLEHIEGNNVDHAMGFLGRLGATF